MTRVFVGPELLRSEAVQGSLRFSLCYHNTEAEIERAVEVLAGVVRRLRAISRRSYS